MTEFAALSVELVVVPFGLRIQEGGQICSVLLRGNGHAVQQSRVQGEAPIIHVGGMQLLREHRTQQLRLSEQVIGAIRHAITCTPGEVVHPIQIGAI